MYAGLSFYLVNFYTIMPIGLLIRRHLPDD